MASFDLRSVVGGQRGNLDELDVLEDARAQFVYSSRSPGAARPHGDGAEVGAVAEVDTQTQTRRVARRACAEEPLESVLQRGDLSQAESGAVPCAIFARLCP